MTDEEWPGGDGQEELGVAAPEEFNKEEELWTNDAGGEFNHDEWPENEPQKEDFGGQDHQDDGDGEQGQDVQDAYDHENEEGSHGQDVHVVEFEDEYYHSSSVEEFIGECEGPESDFDDYGDGEEEDFNDGGESVNEEDWND